MKTKALKNQAQFDALDPKTKTAIDNLIKLTHSADSVCHTIFGDPVTLTLALVVRAQEN